VLQLLFLLEVVEYVTRSVESLLFDDLYLVQSAWSLYEFDKSIDNLDSD